MGGKLTPAQEVDNMLKCVKASDTLFDKIVIGSYLSNIVKTWAIVGSITQYQADNFNSQKETYFSSCNGYNNFIRQEAEDYFMFGHLTDGSHYWLGCPCLGTERFQFPGDVKLKQCPYCGGKIYKSEKIPPPGINVTSQSVKRNIHTSTYANGDKYEGEWENNLKHGEGTYIWANGDKYEGEWKDGKKHGDGTYTWADGGKYIGEWKDDVRHGRGTHTYANGGRYLQIWENGKIVSENKI